MIRLRPLAAMLRPALSALLLSLLLLGLNLRAIGPVPWLERHAGYAAICTGDEIIWVPLSALGFDTPPPGQDPSDAPDSGHCPFGGQIAALLPAPALPGTPAVQPLPPQAPALHLPPRTHHVTPFHARAPPRAA